MYLFLFEDELSSGGEVGMGDAAVGELAAIEGRADGPPGAGTAPAYGDDEPAPGDVDQRTVHERRAELVLARRRVERIDAERGEDV